MSRLGPEGREQLNDVMSQLGPEGPYKAMHTRDGDVGWVDNDYYEQNPWYNSGREKPVFSLGQPLPRKVRQRRPQPKVGQAQQAQPQTNQEPDVEQGLGHDVPPSLISPTTPAPPESRRPEGGNEPDAPPYSANPPLDSTPWQNDPDQQEGTEQARKFQVDADVIGQREKTEVNDGANTPNEMRNQWARFRAKHPEPLAEFLCCGMSVFLGVAANLSVTLSANQDTQYGTYETACWAWGLSFMFGIYLGGGVSGAHMNPAISISLFIFRGFPKRQCFIYIIAQLLASFAGGALAYSIYRDAILNLDPTLTTTYDSFFSVPQPWVSKPTAFFSQFLGGAVVMVAVLSLGDDQNNPPGAGMHAFILGLLVTVLKMTLGYNTGAALSPAADLGPRLVALAAGYKTEHLFMTGWWFYGPWAATISGAIVGSALYDACVFVGSESPVNYRWSREQGRVKNKLRHPFKKGS